MLAWAKYSSLLVPLINYEEFLSVVNAAQVLCLGQSTVAVKTNYTTAHS
jgi:hypothetical protein